MSSDGDLYVASRTRTGRRCSGSASQPTNDLALWSPDGTLIAYTGQPLDDPYSQAFSWVIAPDGTGDKEVILAEGGYEARELGVPVHVPGRTIVRPRA